MRRRLRLAAAMRHCGGNLKLTGAGAGVAPSPGAPVLLKHCSAGPRRWMRSLGDGWNNGDYGRGRPSVSRPGRPSHGAVFRRATLPAHRRHALDVEEPAVALSGTRLGVRRIDHLALLCNDVAPIVGSRRTCSGCGCTSKWCSMTARPRSARG